MPSFYFTFGTNHKDNLGNSLGNSYAVIQSDDYHTARAEMFEMRGDKWAFCYTSHSEVGIDAYNLQRANLLRLKI